MTYTTLPNTDVKVSKICLGSMTWGRQNTEAEGHEQMDYAFDQGINFIDTAELYPVPANAETSGRTSEIIGTWLKKTGNRDKVVIASKIAGTGAYTAHIRTTGFAPGAIREAIDLELTRLQTDYIDLYQLHWPERQTNTFGIRNYRHNPNDPWTDNFNEVLHSLDEMIKAGKIRYVGLSNERGWGTMRFMEEHRLHGLPRMITIQNAHSLLNRTFESDLAEIALRENIGLLAYSPMGFGVLSGKYIRGTAADNSRIKLFPNYNRYSGKQATEATRRYLAIADKHDLSLGQMSLAFLLQQPFLTSAIIGATTMDQLKENIASSDLELSPKVIHEIEAVHDEIPNPAP
jgi:aryl-alcohol dehydrogenase-like predicted oxidoreductase